VPALVRCTGRRPDLHQEHEVTYSYIYTCNMLVCTFGSRHHIGALRIVCSSFILCALYLRYACVAANPEDETRAAARVAVS